MNLITGGNHYNASILSFGGYVGSLVIDNKEIATKINSSEEWILTRSGIKTRVKATDNESIEYMSIQAAKQCIREANLASDDIDMLILSTITVMHQTPALSVKIAHELHLNNVPAFDMSAACAGFTYALSLANSLINNGTAKNILIVCCDRLWDIVDEYDRQTAFLFADGAGAAIVSRTDKQNIGSVVWGSDGEYYGAISQSVDWNNYALDRNKDIKKPYLVMEGNKVFRWTVSALKKICLNAIKAAGLLTEDIDVFVPHQANMRITTSVLNALNLSKDVVVADHIKSIGNTSSASIPLAICDLIKRSLIKSGDKVLIVGFGAGMVYAAQVFIMC